VTQYMGSIQTPTSFAASFGPSGLAMGISCHYIPPWVTLSNLCAANSCCTVKVIILSLSCHYLVIILSLSCHYLFNIILVSFMLHREGPFPEKGTKPQISNQI
jgi:hypothetical protein